MRGAQPRPSSTHQPEAAGEHRPPTPDSNRWGKSPGAPALPPAESGRNTLFAQASTLGHRHFGGPRPSSHGLCGPSRHCRGSLAAFSPPHSATVHGASSALTRVSISTASAAL